MKQHVFPATLAEMPYGEVEIIPGLARITPKSAKRDITEYAVKYGLIPYIKAGPGKGSTAFTPENAAIALVALELDLMGLSGVCSHPYIKAATRAQFVKNRPVGGKSFALGGMAGALERIADGEEVELVINVNGNPFSGDPAQVTAALVTADDGYDEARNALNQKSIAPRFTMRMPLARVLRPLIEFLNED